MGKDNGEKDPQGYSSGLDEEHPTLPGSQKQGHVGFAKGWGTMIKERNLPMSLYFFILLLFVGCFILLPQMDAIRATFGGSSIEQRPKFTKVEVTSPNTTTSPLQNTLNTELTLPERAENLTIPERTENLTLQGTMERTNNLTISERTENPTLPERTENLTLPEGTENPALIERAGGAKNLTLPERIEHSLICPPANMPQTCPTNPSPTSTLMQAKHEASSSMETETCPNYFRWIHEDLKPWKEKGITREAVEAGKRMASFRLVVLDGRVYVETYQKSFQTRDVFTIWGIVQLLRVYPGKVPDLDLMFECGDHPVIRKADYAAKTSAPLPPMFGYCVDDFSFDIPLPDWSFWGWHEINIKPWEAQVEELKKANERVKWIDRVPYAFWKGNLRMGRRITLLRCNSTEHWSAQIFHQKWGYEVKHGFRQSNLADQCTHRYKIYKEGRAWSVSEKYLQACDSMLLLVQPRYYEFFTRSLLPFKHYWPIDPWKSCESIKFAVDWGNSHPKEAEEIGKLGSKFIMEELKMKYIYDYLFHVLSEYGRLFKYKPTVPPGAVEVCLESMICNSSGKEKQAKIDSMAKGPSRTGPCRMPPPYDPQHLQKFLAWKNDISGKVWRGQLNITDMRIIT